MEQLLKQIGRPYQMFFDDGNYQGCFYPIYFVYPDKPHFPLPSDDNRKNYVYGMRLLKQFTEEIEPDELRQGDIITTEYNNELHVALYYEFGKIIHVFRGHMLQVGRLKMFKNYKCFRVIN